MYTIYFLFGYYLLHHYGFKIIGNRQLLSTFTIYKKLFLLVVSLHFPDINKVLRLSILLVSHRYV